MSTSEKKSVESAVPESEKLAVEVIRQIVTHIMTLSAGAIGAVAAFGKGSLLANAGGVLSMGLVSFAVSILTGLMTLGAVVSKLAGKDTDVANGGLVLSFGFLHVLSFMLGIGAILYVALSIV